MMIRDAYRELTRDKPGQLQPHLDAVQAIAACYLTGRLEDCQDAAELRQAAVEAEQQLEAAQARWLIWRDRTARRLAPKTPLGESLAARLAQADRLNGIDWTAAVKSDDPEKDQRRNATLLLAERQASPASRLEVCCQLIEQVVSLPQ